MPAFPITAYSVCNALGRTEREVADAIAESRSGLAPPVRPLPFDTVCGSLPEDLPEPDSSLAEFDSRQARIALATLTEIRPAVDRALARWEPARIGLVIATSTGGIAESESAYEAFHATGRVPDRYSFERQHSFEAFVRMLARATGIAGPAFVVSTACSSSGKVFASAGRMLEVGMVDAVLVGGVDSLALTTLYGFAGLGVLSGRPCRPFSSERDGMNIGEGGALLLIERTGDARALLLGVGESSDAHHMSSPDPNGTGAQLAIRGALRQAKLEPAAIDYVNAHGTGTRHNDAAEAEAIAALFQDQTPVSSTKGFTGHLLGAAGATEAVFSIMALESGWIPANLGADPVDPSVKIRIVPERIRHPCRHVMSTSFGFGGSNVAVVLGAA